MTNVTAVHGASGVSESEAASSRQTATSDNQVFVGEWDEEGVYVYQAYCKEIAEYAIEYQTLGGPHFNVQRMTWFKPSFAWVLYRSGYGRKHHQEMILKIKLSHESLGAILERCKSAQSAHDRAARGGSKRGAARKAGDGKAGSSGGGSGGERVRTLQLERGISGPGRGVVQWDPARSLTSAHDKEPAKVCGERAIQIGVAGSLSELFVASILSIKDVTPLARRVQAAHIQAFSKSPKRRDAIYALQAELPVERPYQPQCSAEALQRLHMQPLPSERSADKRADA